MPSQIIRIFRSFFYTTARHKIFSILLVFLLAFSSCLLVFLAWGAKPPLPSYHDEFSHILAGDTFSSGRITNPEHPMWIHFESFHILAKPTYMSKYPPGQGFFLALGIKLGGHPIAGVWLSFALMCAAVTWMLQAWLPPKWALLGGLLTIFHHSLGVNTYWAHSYWGGSVAALGGALVAGSFRRLISRPSFVNSLIMGIGIFLLLNSRILAGLFLFLPLLVVLFINIFRGRNKSIMFSSVKKVLIPILLSLIITFVFIGYYNYLITGDLTPFVVPLPNRALHCFY